MSPMSGKAPRCRDQRQVVDPFVDARERDQELDDDEELEAALHQELIEMSDCSQPLGHELDEAGD
jgi:hypothetical protein